MSEAHTKGTITVTPQHAERERYKRMFEAACVALGEIGDALGCDPNEGGSEPILDAVDALKETNAKLLAALVALVNHKDDLMPSRLWDAARAAIARAEGDAA